MNRHSFALFGLIAILSAARANCAPINIAIDIDSRRLLGGSNFSGPIETQPGFTSWDLTTFGTAATKVEQGLTLTLFGFSTINQSRNRQAFEGAPVNPLLSDFVFHEGSEGAFIGLQISGLEVGTYFMNSWHYDGVGQLLNSPEFVQIEVRNQGQTAPTPPVVDHFAFGTAPAQFQFSVASAGQVKEILFREDSVTTRTRLNGFTLSNVPEPSGIALVGLASFVFVFSRRHCHARQEVATYGRSNN